MIVPYSVILILCANLNGPIPDKTIIELPPSLVFGMSHSDYEYRIRWAHENHFNVVVQFKNDKLESGFVLYTHTKVMKAGSQVPVYPGAKFMRVGTGIYYKRVLHILYPIGNESEKELEDIYYRLQPYIKEFYGG